MENVYVNNDPIVYYLSLQAVAKKQTNKQKKKKTRKDNEPMI